jgi:hypothetical protein
VIEEDYVIVSLEKLQQKAKLHPQPGTVNKKYSKKKKRKQAS